jgi:DNA-binding transcriptional ArsR family regulator
MALSLLSYEARIISHPTRLSIMMLLEFEHSPNELAKLFGKPLGSVSYHVRDLRSHGAIRETRTEVRRGALEHFYSRSEEGEKAMRKIAQLIDVPARNRRSQEAREAQLLEFLSA